VVNQSFWNETDNYSTESVFSAPAPEVLLPYVSEPLLLKWCSGPDDSYHLLAALVPSCLCVLYNKNKGEDWIFFNEFGLEMVLNLIYC